LLPGFTVLKTLSAHEPRAIAVAAFDHLFDGLCGVFFQKNGLVRSSFSARQAAYDVMNQ
jgi:hypothetical protein